MIYKGVIRVEVPVEIYLDEAVVASATIAEDLNKLRALFKENATGINRCPMKLIECDINKLIER